MTGLLCVCCSTPKKPRRAPDGYRTCNSCADRIREALTEIPATYARLTDVEALLPGSGDEGRRGPGFGSRSPARDVVIAVTDRRTVWAEDSRLHHPPAILNGWASMVRDQVGEKPPPGPPMCNVEAALLVRRLDHVTRQEWVADMWRELREVINELRTIAGEPRPTPVGHCPTVVDDTTGKVCGTRLYVQQGTDTITCRGCGRQWERREWLHLGRTMGAIA